MGERILDPASVELKLRVFHNGNWECERGFESFDAVSCRVENVASVSGTGVDEGMRRTHEYRGPRRRGGRA
jgi:hypothetical protein